MSTQNDPQIGTAACIDMICKAMRICSLERLKACIMTLFQTIYSESFEWHLSLCCLDQFDHRSLFLGNDRGRDIRHHRSR